jgi:hypothetical protein
MVVHIFETLVWYHGHFLNDLHWSLSEDQLNAICPIWIMSTLANACSRAGKTGSDVRDGWIHNILTYLWNVPGSILGSGTDHTNRFSVVFPSPSTNLPVQYIKKSGHHLFIPCPYPIVMRLLSYSLTSYSLSCWQCCQVRHRHEVYKNYHIGLCNSVENTISLNIL